MTNKSGVSYVDGVNVDILIIQECSQSRIGSELRSIACNITLVSSGRIKNSWLGYQLNAYRAMGHPILEWIWKKRRRLNKKNTCLQQKYDISWILWTKWKISGSVNDFFKFQNHRICCNLALSKNIYICTLHLYRHKMYIQAYEQIDRWT